MIDLQRKARLICAIGADRYLDGLMMGLMAQREHRRKQTQNQKQEQGK